jgi:hypothetical protein
MIRRKNIDQAQLTTIGRWQCNQLNKFKKINTNIAEVAINKFERHLWYLGPELVPLALFFDKLPSNEKLQIRDAIVKNSHEALESTYRCLNRS